ncbi:MAG: 3-deoxy-8-phosphooctulonate synthase [candidate division WOR-3 bacterium]|nr:3-deoxy-8-phosphooctulonate synthase [candidate division WOR-3 bacterium]MCX7947956.1 3-deoxy-8-phosphooctulonate synthase [candidate division WOR-3 bacterium]MDW8150900.1 3-deoxy-8-phosphooctulonate synthase [candidate division WOR-3 bacterium]
MNNFFLIAGPCVIESEDVVFYTAKVLKEIATKLNLKLYFKTSYDKANRTSIKSYRGPGIQKGLEILKEVKNKFGLEILTDVHDVHDVEKVAEVVDVIQIPAFLSRQTDLILEVARTKRIVNVKKAQFMSPWDVKFVIEKIESTGNGKIWITERGYMFGYNNLVVDFRSIVIMRKFGYPIVYDATHSLQKPSAESGFSGGEREFIPYLARAAVAVGIDGLFMETHPNPEEALSDNKTQYPLDKIEELLKQLIEIDKLVRSSSF